MVRKDGICQIMDFGLAKLRASGSKITRLTKEGSTVGTAGYMSPEQVQGQEADHRSDIFSLGVVLYELFTGELPFKGVHETALLYEIVNVDPAPMSAVKPDLDPELDRIVLECLQKEPDERYNSVKDIAKDLKRFKRESSRQRVSRVTAARPAIKVDRSANPQDPAVARRRPNPGYLVSAVLVAVILVLLWSPWKKEAIQASPVVRFSVKLPDNAPLQGGTSGIAISPDGKNFVYRAHVTNGTQLYIHRMDQLTSQPLPGTESAAEPAFSPDGQWIVFGANQGLIKVSITGGAPELICPLQNATRGIFWASDNTILFGIVNDAIFRVPAAGGTPVRVTTLDSSGGEISHRFPQLLPDGKTILFTVKQNNITTFDDAIIVAQKLDQTERRVLIRGGAYPKYLPNGYLTYMRGNAMLAVPFDVDHLEIKGTAVAVEQGGWFLQGAGNATMDFSANGTLVFAPTGAQTGNANSLSWMDRHGSLSPLYDTLKPYTVALLSPDGQKIALGINAANNDIWVYHIARSVLSRITFGGGNNDFPIWSPDGKYIVYSAEKGKTQNLFRKPWDGGGNEERLTTSPNLQVASSFAPDGKVLSLNEKGDIWTLNMEGDHKAQPFIQSPANETDGLFSPDGKWMSYTSDETGKREVYVTSFPEHRGKWQISNGGGGGQLWSRDGKELFYFNGNTIMMVNVLAQGETFDFSVPRKLCDEPPDVDTQDISVDGKLFLVRVSQTQRVTLPELEVVTNWFQVVEGKFSANRN